MTTKVENKNWSGLEAESRLRMRVAIGWHVQNDENAKDDLAWLLLKFDEAMGELERLRESGVRVVWPFAVFVAPTTEADEEGE